MAANKGKYKAKSAQGYGIVGGRQARQFKKLGMKAEGYGPKGRKRKKATIVRRGKRAYLQMPK